MYGKRSWRCRFTFANIVKRVFNRPFDTRLLGFVDAVHEVGGDRNKLSVLGTSFDTMTLNPFVPIALLT